jgi:hypothetical protein
MDNVTFVEFTNLDGTTTEYAIIDRGNNEFTSIEKAGYLALQDAQSANKL